MTVRIAVLLCTHNGEGHLGTQLRSLAEQTLAPAALFLHDWGSTDGTLGQLLAFADRFGHMFPIIVREHCDAPGARDSFVEAIDQSIGSDLPFDYLALCDQDDLWSTRKLSVCATRLADPTGPVLDLLHSDVRIVGLDGRAIADSFYAGATAFRPPLCLQDPSILLANPVIGMTLCVSRRCLLAVRHELRGPWMMHDWAIVLLALSHGFATAYVAQPLVDYRQHPSNVLGAAMGLRLVARLRKARGHFSRVRTQIALLDRVNRHGWRPLATRILRGGLLQRFHAARAAFRSTLLRRPSRLLLGCAILVLW